MPMDTPTCAQADVPLKALPCGGARLDLACIGLDDANVDEQACAKVFAEMQCLQRRP
jgi:hypothetical protein